MQCQCKPSRKAALDRHGVCFYSSWADKAMTMEQRIDHLIDVLGVKMTGAPDKAWADYARQKTGRTMPVQEQRRHHSP